MAAKFLSNTSGEFLKTKRTAAFWLTLLGAAFVPIINFIKCVARPDVFVPRYKANVWNIFINENWEVASAFLLVVYIILVTGLVIHIEYRNNTWKQVYASPRTYADIFFYLLLVLLVLLFWSLFGYFDARRNAPVAIGSIYWHFVDAVWLVVFFTIYVTPYLGVR